MARFLKFHTGSHWVILSILFCLHSDIRAKLEMSITHVMDLHKRQEEMVVEESDYTSDSEDVSWLVDCLNLLDAEY